MFCCMKKNYVYITIVIRTSIICTYSCVCPTPQNQLSIDIFFNPPFYISYFLNSFIDPLFFYILQTTTFLVESIYTFTQVVSSFTLTTEMSNGDTYESVKDPESKEQNFDRDVTNKDIIYRITYTVKEHCWTVLSPEAYYKQLRL